MFYGDQKCPGCDKVMVKPVKLSCNHRQCKKCVEFLCSINATHTTCCHSTFKLNFDEIQVDMRYKAQLKRKQPHEFRLAAPASAKNLLHEAVACAELSDPRQMRVVLEWGITPSELPTDPFFVRPTATYEGDDYKFWLNVRPKQPLDKVLQDKRLLSDQALIDWLERKFAQHHVKEVSQNVRQTHYRFNNFEVDAVFKDWVGIGSENCDLVVENSQDEVLNVWSIKQPIEKYERFVKKLIKSKKQYD